jgi:hypothetical protein
MGYGINQKYLPIWVSVSVSDRNQNSGFGRTLLRLLAQNGICEILPFLA